MVGLKLKKNEYGLRVACSKCDRTFNENSVKTCKHNENQKYKSMVYIGDSTKSTSYETRDYDEALKFSIEFKRDVKKGVYDVEPVVVNKNELLSKSKNTPIEDRKLQGQIIKTFIKGEIAFERA